MRPDCVAVLLGVLAPVSTGASAFRAEPNHGPAVAHAALPMSPDANRLVKWVRRSGDHGGMPFIVIDKRRAQLWLFEADGSLRGDTPVLLGLARGDHSVPGIGVRPMARIRPHEHTLLRLRQRTHGLFRRTPGSAGGVAGVAWSICCRKSCRWPGCSAPSTPCPARADAGRGAPEAQVPVSRAVNAGVVNGGISRRRSRVRRCTVASSR